MLKKIDTALVRLWGNIIGAVSWLDDRDYGIFEYDPEFLNKGLDIAPVHMRLEDARNGHTIFSFASLNKQTFLGLPGLLADALPDKFGNHIIDAWLAHKGRHGASFSPIERLCHIGKRGMGALEFSPAMLDKHDKSVPVEIPELIALTQNIMTQRLTLNVDISQSEQANADAIMDILRVETSAGGAWPKAVIAMDKQGNVMSGQTQAPGGYDYWILKFDGVTNLDLGKPGGYGRIEYAYYLMAEAAGIHMSECRLLEETGRAHFMTKRFDRINGTKLHMQSLCGIAHYDFNMAGAYSYEQAFAMMRKIRLSKVDAIQQYRRMVFNIIARNLDDHTKNIAFLMDPDGKWQLSPAYDMIYAHNPTGQWTAQHQMSVNGKRDGINKADLITVAKSLSLPKPDEVIHDVISAVERWPEFAKQAGINSSVIKEIAGQHRLDLSR